jgi:parallel beta-helix repeat protein
MRTKLVLILAVALIVTSLYWPIFKVQSTRTADIPLYVPTFYIRANGTIEQPTPVISSLDNITYTYNSSIYGSLKVERSNITVDFAGFTIQGSGSEAGVNLIGVNNVTVKNSQIRTFGYGIVLGYNSSGNTIVENNITTTLKAISVGPNSSNNTISRNQITSGTERGIWIDSSGDNTVSYNNVTGCGSGIAFEENANRNDAIGNNVTGNGGGIFISGSSNNTVEKNNATGNNVGVDVRSASGNMIIGNIMTGNNVGIECEMGSMDNNVSGNKIAGSKYIGIELESSSNNTLRNNAVTDSKQYSFGLLNGDMLNDVDKSNTIDGKPILYLVNRQNLIVDAETEPSIAYLALVNSTNITIRNLEFKNNMQGIVLIQSKNCLIQNVTVINNLNGIQIHGSTYDGFGNNTILGCNVTSNPAYGIEISSARYGNPLNNNTLLANVIANSYYGISIRDTDNNTVQDNSIMNNSEGIKLYTSNNVVSHNNFVDNKIQADVRNVNFWDDGYPSGGNYWSNYNGTDMLSGPYHNITGSDGIGDIAYTLDLSNTDHYPLTGMFSGYTATARHSIQSICNSTISNLQFNGTAISFDVSGPSGTTGFCRICIPRALLGDAFRVFVNGTEVEYTLLPPSDSTSNYLYFTYHHSMQEVIIMPEFPSFLILPLLVTTTLLAIMLYKRKREKRCERAAPSETKQF